MAVSGLLAVLVLIHNTGGLLGAQVSSSIVGGQDSPKDRWPYMAHLNLSDSDGGKWRCGGTIVGKQYILTAANCWDRDPEPNWRRSMIVVGAYNLHEASSGYMEIETMTKHPGYRALSRGFINDIALVKLKKPLSFNSQVKVVSRAGVDDSFGPTSECWIVGWGNTATDVPLSGEETLQQVKIPIISHDVCKTKYPELNSDMLCAGDLAAGGKDACKGDYGGPLMCRKAGGGMVQVGIMSYGSPDGCGLPDRPGVYTQVSKYQHYIDGYIKQGEEASAEE